MELTEKNYLRISKYLPRQRGNVKTDNRVLLNALLYVVENGCKWRALPERFGKWATVYKRLNRWSKSGVLKRVFEGLQKENIFCINVEITALDSTCCKVHPNGCGALKKKVNNQLERQRVVGIPNFIWYPQMINLP
jgi:transposase